MWVDNLALGKRFSAARRAPRRDDHPHASQRAHAVASSWPEVVTSRRFRDHPVRRTRGRHRRAVRASALRGSPWDGEARGAARPAPDGADFC